MRIIIPSVQVPFVFGGAQLMTEGIADALLRHGHEVEIIRFPFKFFPESHLQLNMDFCLRNDFNQFNGVSVDLVLALQFPAYYVQHHNKVLWLMHQHRAVYELYHLQAKTSDLSKLRSEIITNDNRELALFKKKFSISGTVSNRLKHFNDVDSVPLYHPPASEEKFFCDDYLPFIFVPSRLEMSKRQDLIIRALQYTRHDVSIIIAGTGTFENNYKELVETLNLKNRVRFTGYISENEKLLYYARCLAVFFGPLDEDYGYITLEAMLSSKAIITCNDSGGPLEFVRDNDTGYIVDPNPELIAVKLDEIYENRTVVKRMGRDARNYYQDLDLNWDNVVDKLMQP